eukprot:CAMPEP_0197242514 /NCGR_PEP_ID=MMETSP1429-20130617/8243_1 /TAXON_ID=49237 /ORGANISM="Chaetoceros  sp., Strain UNC1202" /LENGTH=567 /DNA_ID=CAMNT_0042702569 /DNA_START=1784 /DNA_END=3487 /DNA_ORIENTATION=-
MTSPPINPSTEDSGDIIVLSPYLELVVPNDLRLLTDGPRFQQLVKDTYGGIDIKSTLESLVDCGQMLQIALTAAGDQSCSVPILKILSKYQNLVHSCTVTSNAFVGASLQSLLSIRDAQDFLQELENDDLVEGLPDVLQSLADCFDTAQRMAAKAGEVAAEVGELTDLAEEGVLSAKKDLNANDEENKEIERQMQKMKAHTSATVELLSSYASRVKQLGEERDRAAKAASEARDKHFALDVISSVIAGVGQMTSTFAAACNPVLAVSSQITGAVAVQTTDHGMDNARSDISEENSKSTAPSNDLKVASLKLENEVKKKEQLLTDAQGAPDRDTADGKKLIEGREKELEAVKVALKSLSDSMSEMSRDQKELAVSLEEKESQLTGMYYEMAETEAKTAAEQKKNLEELKNMNTEKTQLQQTIFLLRFSYGIMGEVKTSFLNVKTFWELLAAQCQKIADTKNTTMDLGDKVLTKASAGGSSKMFDLYRHRFLQGIQRSAITWAGVGRVSLDAYDAIVDAKSVTDGAMKALPTGKETGETIDRLIAQLEPRIASKVKLHQGKKPVALLKN